MLGEGGHTPFADYWATLLWKRLMGERVLAIGGDDEPNRTVRAYAHCLARVPVQDAAKGGVALAIINMQNASVQIDIGVSSLSAADAGQATANASGVLARMLTWQQQQQQQQQQQPREPVLHREVYRLGTVEGVFTGHRATLNGVELSVGSGGVLPALAPTWELAAALLHLEPLSVSFVVLPTANVAGCV